MSAHHREAKNPRPLPPRSATDGEPFRYHHVERQVLAMIESGRYTPGDRLPSLRSVCTSMGVSLATANHAYMELERKGIVEARPRSGFFVRNAVSHLPLPAAQRAISGPDAPCKPADRHGLGGSAPYSSGADGNGADGSGTGEENRTRLIQKVLEAVGNTRMVSFGCVSPDPALLPGKALARIMQDVLRFSPGQALAYEVIQGNEHLRRQIAWRAQQCGLRAEADDVLVTAGAMEALYITLRCLTRPGDNVVIQSPTYFCFIQLLENLGLRAIEVPSSPEHGVSPAALREAISKYSVAACILSANFNNPDGALMPDAAKREIVSMLAERGIPLVEDDVAGDVHFGPSRPAPLKAFDTRGTVTLCSSFSKTIAPGYRAGWMLPGAFMSKALEIKATTNVCCPSPTQMVIAEFLGQGLYERHLKRLRAATERQMQTVRHQLATHFPPGTRVTRPEGGAFLWVALPEGMDSVRLFNQAKARDILIAPGPIFTTRDRYRNYIRLSCCGVWNESMQQAMRTLGQLAAPQALPGRPEELLQQFP